MGERSRGAVKFALWAVGLAAAGAVVFRFLLPILTPFLLAFLTAAVCAPAVELLTRRAHMRRGIASALCVLTVLASLVGFFLLVVTRVVNEAVGLARELPNLASGLTELTAKLERELQKMADSAPEAAGDYLRDALAAISRRAAELPAEISAWAVGKVSAAAAAAPETALGIATYAIGSFFISAGFEDIKSFLSRQIPERFRATAARLKEEILGSLGRWFRAEASMLGITFAELTAAFTFLRVDYAAVIALVTAVIDALPVFGTGIVLLPWAVVSLLAGETGRAAGLGITYITVTVVRSVLEPKLMGNEFGVSPAAALLAMYAGFKLLGVTGMIVFPFTLMVVSELNKKGIISLWK